MELSLKVSCSSGNQECGIENGIVRCSGLETQSIQSQIQLPPKILLWTPERQF